MDRAGSPAMAHGSAADGTGLGISRDEALQAYRRAFASFAGSLQAVERLQAQPHPDLDQLEDALTALERARLAYSQSRDALARHLADPAAQRLLHPLPPAENTPERVRAIAELLWVSAGRPDGTAEADWYRAERIVEKAVA